MSQKKHRRVLLGAGTIRNNHTFYRSASKSKYKCINCENETLTRLRAGIWSCKTCKIEITGNAYTPY